jgi:hypothetical protein
MSERDRDADPVLGAIREGLDLGLPLKVIANRAGVSRATVTYWREKLGKAAVIEARRARLDPVLQVLAGCYAAGMVCDADVGARLGVSAGQVWHARRRLGIPAVIGGDRMKPRRLTLSGPRA